MNSWKKLLRHIEVATLLSICKKQTHISFTLHVNDHKRVGNQISGLQLDVHVMKIESTVVEMFYKVRMVLLLSKTGRKMSLKEKNKPEIENSEDLMKILLCKLGFYSINDP